MHGSMIHLVTKMLREKIECFPFCLDRRRQQSTKQLKESSSDS